MVRREIFFPLSSQVFLPKFLGGTNIMGWGARRHDNVPQVYMDGFPDTITFTIFRFRGCLKKSSIINFLSHHLATSSPISFRIREISTKTRITLSHSSKSGQIRRQHATKCCTFPVLHRAAVIDSVSHNYSPSFPLSTSNFSVSHNYSPSFPLSTSNF